MIAVPLLSTRRSRQHSLPRAIGWRSGLFVPMLRDGAPIGVIVVTRPQPGHFSGSEIELLKTFADQAVIAIENTRLFEEVQARTKELQDSLDRQTAISGHFRARLLEVLAAVLQVDVYRATAGEE
jgi:GAF domain-containing protein